MGEGGGTQGELVGSGVYFLWCIREVLKSIWSFKVLGRRWLKAVHHGNNHQKMSNLVTLLRRRGGQERGGSSLFSGEEEENRREK